MSARAELREVARELDACASDLMVRKWDQGNTDFSQLRITVPAETLYSDAALNDHLRWLNAATASELVDALCKRPHEELAPHAGRLQDRLHIFAIVSNTFNSRDELEKQHATIESLHA